MAVLYLAFYGSIISGVLWQYYICLFMAVLYLAFYGSIISGVLWQYYIWLFMAVLHLDFSGNITSGFSAIITFGFFDINITFV